MPTQVDLVLRLLLAAALAGALGVERELTEQPAGFRTHILVGGGAALFAVISAFGFQAIFGADPHRTAPVDPSRVVAQIVVGIGFLGGGAILKYGASVRGLTTAASLWITAAVGTAVGIGMLLVATATTGIALVEGYDLDPTAGSKFGNISTRGFVGTGANVMIAGVIVHGLDSENVIIRGLGPTLTQFGVPSVLSDPTLDLRDSNGNSLMTNDNWKDSQQAQIQESGLAPPDDSESAIAITLGAGNYTAILRGKNNITGNGLVEVYELN